MGWNTTETDISIQVKIDIPVTHRAHHRDPNRVSSAIISIRAAICGESPAICAFLRRPCFEISSLVNHPLSDDNLARAPRHLLSGWIPYSRPRIHPLVPEVPPGSMFKPCRDRGSRVSVREQTDPELAQCPGQRRRRWPSIESTLNQHWVMLSGTWLTWDIFVDPSNCMGIK